MCTVLLRFQPDAVWPLVVAAIRDEFVDRTWDPPAAHWPDEAPGVYGGRDRSAGGTWLGVRPDRPAVAALLNGVRLPEQRRPTRGTLPLAALNAGLNSRLEPESVREYDGFHLMLGSPEGVVVWSWDGDEVTRTDLTPGDHIIVNQGLNAVSDPLVPHFLPLLGKTQAVGEAEAEFWDGWLELLRGDGLPPDDPRALIMRHEIEGRSYGSTSASLVALRRDAVRYDFTASPQSPQWTRIL